jgi:hypothetical protein
VAELALPALERSFLRIQFFEHMVHHYLERSKELLPRKRLKPEGEG